MKIILSWFIIFFVLGIFFGKAKFDDVEVYGIKRILCMLVISAGFSVIFGLMTIGALYLLGLI